MKMANDYYCCPQTWTLAKILNHMRQHGISMIPVLTGENGLSLVGVIEKDHLEEVILQLKFDPARVTAKDVFDQIKVKRI